ncbi:uncharacterized protein B0P05DRAFT_605584 [Gilbertella persicaria]|uniref:uncharacterized protein n=1 Tax=Gilbertella persicaria TaxID=101096 RepID=UPI00222108B8|nr:uncharacterized protein B0P05DRAFT_605584 [Gilbertella persicaria]KAI8063726.1 hypothetical protein B0P05DRAFT_605584 [Gilbertella persicaria]
MNLLLYMVLNAAPDYWAHRHPRFLTNSMFIFDPNANRLRLKVSTEYTRFPRLYNRSVSLKAFLWDHILQAPAGQASIRMSPRWSRFTPHAYRLFYQDVSINKYNLGLSPRCSLCCVADDTFRHFVIDCPKKWEVWQQTLSHFFPHNTLALCYLHVLRFITKPKIFFTIIGTIHWQLWNLYWQHGNSNPHVASQFMLLSVHTRSINLIETLTTTV